MALADGAYAQVAAALSTADGEVVDLVTAHPAFVEVVIADPAAANHLRGQPPALAADVVAGLVDALGRPSVANRMRLALTAVHLAAWCVVEGFDRDTMCAVAATPEVLALAIASNAEFALNTAVVLLGPDRIDDAELWAEVLAQLGETATLALLEQTPSGSVLAGLLPFRPRAGSVDQFNQWARSMCRLLSERLEGADPRVVDVVVALQTGWEGTLGALVDAAEACVEPCYGEALTPATPATVT
jgi:hypothetical protein